MAPRQLDNGLGMVYKGKGTTNITQMAGVSTAVQTSTPTGTETSGDNKSENVLVGFEGYTDENN